MPPFDCWLGKSAVKTTILACQDGESLHCDSWSLLRSVRMLLGSRVIEIDAGTSIKAAWQNIYCHTYYPYQPRIFS